MFSSLIPSVRKSRGWLAAATLFCGSVSIIAPDSLRGQGCGGCGECAQGVNATSCTSCNAFASCNECASCDLCYSLPRIQGLGDGLLCKLDRATSRMSANLFGMRCSSCLSGCGSACDGCGCSSEPSMGCSHGSGSPYMTSPYFGESMSGSMNHSAGEVLHSLPPTPSMPSAVPESPVPMPIPDPIASPPAGTRTPIRAPIKQGNPFVDEARFVPAEDEFVRPIRITPPAPSPKKSEVVVAKVNVKPVPKHLLRGTTPPSLSDEKSRNAESQVITAGSIGAPKTSEIQFAR